MRRTTNFLVAALGLMMIIVSCDDRSDLQKLVDTEMATGVRNDSLFFGIQFGMEQQEFYDHCWKINRQGLVKEGPENMSVLYMFEHGGYDVDFNFFPEFAGGKAYKYNCSFNYDAWAPWNKQLQADDMLAVAPEILEKWYGGNAFVKSQKRGKPYYYKVDGNRLIELSIKDERLVNVVISDLTVYNKNLN